jgi:hypothetical protein
MRRKSVLPVETENELVNNCLLMEINCFGLTTKDIKRMLLHSEIRSNLPLSSSTEKGKAVKKWLRNF